MCASHVMAHQDDPKKIVHPRATVRPMWLPAVAAQRRQQHVVLPAGGSAGCAHYCPAWRMPARSSLHLWGSHCSGRRRRPLRAASCVSLRHVLMLPSCPAPVTSVDPGLQQHSTAQHTMAQHTTLHRVYDTHTLSADQQAVLMLVVGPMPAPGLRLVTLKATAESSRHFNLSS